MSNQYGCIAGCWLYNWPWMTNYATRQACLDAKLDIQMHNL